MSQPLQKKSIRGKRIADGQCSGQREEVMSINEMSGREEECVLHGGGPRARESSMWGGSSPTN